uniref:Uncharacterized protein n=1 Tax=Glossina austeni TaxID=7395 RepID=A0A1A9VKU6_GLOAU
MSRNQRDALKLQRTAFASKFLSIAMAGHRGADHVYSATEVLDGPTQDFRTTFVPIKKRILQQKWLVVARNFDRRRLWALRCQAQVHRSQVVSPSAATLSSRNGGRGGGGTKRPFHRPFSLASKANGDSSVSFSMAFDHQSSSAAGNKFLIDVAFVPTSLMGAVASKSAVIEGSYGDNNHPGEGDSAGGGSSTHSVLVKLPPYSRLCK